MLSDTQVKEGRSLLSRGLQILSLMDELGRMPESKLFTEFQGFSTSIYIFDKDYVDLHNLISVLATDPRADPLFTVQHRDQLMMAMREVIRLFHNYVAASLSLIDHTRRLYVKLYAGTGKFTDYETRKNAEFAHDPLSQFIGCLRRYCQHYRAPNLNVTTSWESGDARPTRTFRLLREDLEAFDGWSATARKYLVTAGNEIDILRVTTEYRDKIISFYTWFQARQQEIHREDIERYREQERKLFLLILEDKLENAFAKSEQGIPHRKDEIFASVFTSKEFEEIERIPRDSQERPSRAIELLEQRFFLIPQEMKEQIISLYRLPDILGSAGEK